MSDFNFVARPPRALWALRCLGFAAGLATLLALPGLWQTREALQGLQRNTETLQEQLRAHAARALKKAPAASRLAAAQRAALLSSFSLQAPLHALEAGHGEGVRVRALDARVAERFASAQVELADAGRLAAYLESLQAQSSADGAWEVQSLSSPSPTPGNSGGVVPSSSLALPPLVLPPPIPGTARTQRPAAPLPAHIAPPAAASPTSVVLHIVWRAAGR